MAKIQTDERPEMTSDFKHNLNRIDADPVVEAELHVADQVGRMMDFWGFKRIHGKVWATLFLAKEPLSNRQIQERLGISAGATSMALNDLRQLGAVREAPVQQRAVHFEPETNIWRIVSRVLQQRERQVFAECTDVFENALNVLRNDRCKPHSSTHDDTDRIAHTIERIERLVMLTRLAQGMLNMLLSRGELVAEDTKKMRV